mmetsp:Transcript_1464/g.5398  ORF Transcript_1464/g.5398 Transcript_1464/m.5398 type:complete len:224 (+) Transcript_1464:237-908(+)
MLASADAEGCRRRPARSCWGDDGQRRWRSRWGWGSGWSGSGCARPSKWWWWWRWQQQQQQQQRRRRRRRRRRRLPRGVSVTDALLLLLLVGEARLNRALHAFLQLLVRMRVPCGGRRRVGAPHLRPRTTGSGRRHACRGGRRAHAAGAAQGSEVERLRAARAALNLGERRPCPRPGAEPLEVQDERAREPPQPPLQPRAFAVALLARVVRDLFNAEVRLQELV